MCKLKILSKGRNKKLSEHFMQHEIDCKCQHKDCTFTLVAQKTIDCLEAIRTSCGNKPIIITSGFRCMVHCRDVGSVRNSFHKKGLATDLLVPIGMEFNEFLFRLDNIFEVTIPYKKEGFIHAHNTRE